MVKTQVGTKNVGTKKGYVKTSKKATKKGVKSVRAKKHLRYKCLTFQQGKTVFAMFSCPAKELYSFVEINKREEDKDEGYQRVLSISRVNKIAKFIDANGSIPLSVLVSFDHAIIEDGHVVIDNVPNAGWVIDGQHRIAGASKAKSDIPLPVVAVFKIDVPEQVNYFVTINREQKGVPTALYLDLLKIMPGTKSEKELRDERAADLADICRYDENSPFYQRIVVTTSPKNGQLSLTNWVRKVAPLLDPREAGIARLADEDRAKAIANLYSALKIVFPKEYARTDTVFFKTIGFGALMNEFKTIWDLTTRSSAGNFRTADVAKTLKSIADFDFGSWRSSGTGNQAEVMAGADLREQLNEAHELLTNKIVQL